MIAHISNFFAEYPYFDYLTRIFLALVLGFSIGFERKSRSKEAGIRTHTIVAVGSALFMIISRYGFGSDGDFDKSRVAAQVVAGIGFLGAGMIMHQRQSIHGLTTAAGIWTTAGIGMAAAAGLYVVAIGSTVLVIAVQLLLHSDFVLFKMRRTVSYKVVFSETEDSHETLKKIFGVEKFAHIKTERRNDGLFSFVTVKTEKPLSDFEVSAIIKENDFVLSCESIGNDLD